jgi:hypothetical protein
MPAGDMAIRNGLKTRLLTIPTLTAYNHVPGQMNTPAACVSRARTAYDATMADGSDDSEYIVTVFVPYADPDLAQQLMSVYLARTGANSVKACIEGDVRLGGALPGDQTLGGVVDFAIVKEAGEDEIRMVNGFEHLAVDFKIDVTG